MIPPPASTSIPPALAPPLPAAAPAERRQVALLWLGLPLCAFGIFHYRLWEQWHSGRFGELLLLSLLAWGLAWPLRKFARWSWATALALPWCLALLLFAGVVPVMATLALATTALALGGLLDARSSPRMPPALQITCGLALLGALLGWLLPLPVHFRWSYLGLGLLLAGLRRKQLLECARSLREDWMQSVAAAPRIAGIAVLALGLASTGSWLPTLQVDDLGYHLRLPWELLEQGRYAMDPETHVWALAPWLGDVLQAFPQVIAGEEARGPVNALWMLLTASGVWRLGKALGGDARANWAAMALYASLPLTASLAGSMQTETPTAALLVWLVVLIVQATEVRGRGLLCGAVLVGGLLALKLAAAAAALVLLPWAMWRHRNSLRLLPALAAAAMALALGASSYAYAWIIAGNPFLPLFNTYFHSPYFQAADFDDVRWHAGFNALLPWRLTFDTSRYLEAFAGGGGFVLVALSGGWVLALMQRRTSLIAMMMAVSIALPLIPMQYLRYAFPACVLLLPLLATTALRADPRHAAWLLGSVCLLNFAFQANGHWMLRTGAVKETILALGDDHASFRHYAPERILLAQLRGSPASAGNVLAMDPDSAWVAEMGARARTTSRYDPSLAAAATAADPDASGDAWRSLFQKENITEVLLRKKTLTEAQRNGLRRANATLRAELGEAQWWSVEPQEARP
ncbi:hypothetical protein [Pseudoxanthomonas yeongjuensis]|uniref:hypothetical protein n=1 Tax=Pseudoxanthomonas yeongjuensis TaxID=377616 RepID=UPI0013913093|nr:hypothetical protein [Pseudoxanthomonas yeongjuensis]